MYYSHCPETHSTVDQADLEFRDPPDSAPKCWDLVGSSGGIFSEEVPSFQITSLWQADIKLGSTLATSPVFSSIDRQAFVHREQGAGVLL